MGSFMGKALDVGLVAKKRMAPGELMFSFRVGDALVGEETLLGQHGSFVDFLIYTLVLLVDCAFSFSGILYLWGNHRSTYDDRSEWQIKVQRSAKENSWVVAAFLTGGFILNKFMH
ncbi:hypothetical protein CK203_067429 [Vitis vinifera]|uniref:Uncharacterized protein n=1 Tax=Vitis vinifera TaxID=29760 RepID=A0A438EC11_VITVI|nr:hypothetical protein CK203_067429 [Vitis vinifera]